MLWFTVCCVYGGPCVARYPHAQTQRGSVTVKVLTRTLRKITEGLSTSPSHHNSDHDTWSELGGLASGVRGHDLLKCVQGVR